MAKKNETAMTAPQPPTETALAVYDFGEDEGLGYEGQSKADTSIPWMILLQALSPLVQDEARSLKAGQWFNTVTEKAYERDTGFLFVPGTTRHYYAEWTPRKDGGGFHGHHDPEEEVVLKALKDAKRFGKNKIDAVEYDKDGNARNVVHELVETFYAYGALVDPETMEPLGMTAIAFKSTMIRPYKGWMTRLREVRITKPDGTKTRPPMFAHLTRIASKKEKNNDGEFYVPAISSANGDMAKSLLSPDHEAYQMAKACRDLITSGDAKISYEKSAATDEKGDVPF